MVSYDEGNSFVWKTDLKSPLHRVEVTPDSSPELPRARGTLRTQHHQSHHQQQQQHHRHHHQRGASWTNGSFTIPASRPSATERGSPRNTLAQSSRRYARSEVVRGTGWYSNGIHAGGAGGAVNRPVNQPISQARPAVRHEDILLHTSTPYPTMEAQRGVAATTHHSAYGSHRQVAGGQAAMLVGGQQEAAGGLAWLQQVKRESGRVGMARQGSYSASVVSMEVDGANGRKGGAGLGAQQSGTESKAEGQGTAMTIERAVALLTQDNVDMQVSAASFLQHQCFNSADAKKMVFYLHAIQKLIGLLQSDSEELQQAAAGALRNIVFESNQNKMEVRDCEGIPAILRLLRKSRDVETRRHLTGLLWNLSSHDQLKEYLLREALRTLTESVLVPCSGMNEGENPKEDLLSDNEVFYNTTGCLRNLSSAGPDGRRAMRESTGLIDALIYYTRGAIADYKPDDKSTENSVCILHNLSYQLEPELPQRYASHLRETRHNAHTVKTKSPGCFPVRSVEVIEEPERHCPLLEDKANPSGVEWLWSAITLRMYLSLIARSTRHYTQEASVGALQNLTAGSGPIAESLAHAVVQREAGLSQMKTLLEEGELSIKKTTVSLLRNVSRFRDLHTEIIKQVLPELVAMLPNSDSSPDLPADVIVSLCHILINLCQADAQSIRAVLSHGALPKVISISTRDNGYGPTRAAQTACVLLHTMWRHSELRTAYKKAGYRKSDFINNRTLKALPTRD
ncbi:plakophilin-2 isoform X2 [Engraulis encrasicolus]